MTKTTTHYLEATIQPAGDELTGREWAVTIIGPGSGRDLVTVEGKEYIRSKNGRLYATEALEAAAAQFEGVKVYDDHMTQEEFEARSGMRSPAREWLGSIVGVAWDAARRQLRGVFKVVDDTLAGKLRRAHESGVLGSIGLSLDAILTAGGEVELDGQRMPLVVGLPKIHSVDLVGNPAAGGRFERILAAEKSTGGDNMSEQDDRLEKLETMISGLADQFTTLSERLKPAAESEAETEEEEIEDSEQDNEIESEGGVEDSQAREAIALIRSERQVERAIAAAKLPAQFARVVEAATAGRVVSERELKQLIDNTKAAQASQDSTGRVTESGKSRISGMTTGDELAEVAFLRLMMGNRGFKALKGSDNEHVNERKTEAYRSWLKSGGEYDNARRMSEWVYSYLGGDPFSDHRAYEAVTTSNMTSIVKNAMNVMLAVAYSRREEWWRPIVIEEELDTIDQATLVRTYGVSSLDVINEGNAYTALSWADDEETAAFVKKGNYIGVTLETLLRDKLNEVRSVPTRLANAWFNTLSDLVANVFTVNSAAGPVLADTGALFNATAATTAGGHANLLTTAFGTTTAAYSAARTAMMKQTDQALGAGRRLAMDNRPRYALVPVDLQATAQEVLNSEVVPGASNAQANTFRGESQVIAVPSWTDATDWALVADPEICPAIYLLFLRGRRLPEIFASESETAGAMFTNDELRYKVRLMTWRFSATYDCAPVADFRGLHKSNVA